MLLTDEQRDIVCRHLSQYKRSTAIELVMFGAPGTGKQQLIHRVCCKVWRALRI